MTTIAQTTFRFISNAVAMFIAAAALSTSASAQIKPIQNPQPTANDGTIEVLEFFSYGCGGCAAVEPALEAWIKTLPVDVKFKRVPSGFNLQGIDEIPLFHTLEAMGQIDRLHGKIFAAVHSDRAMLGHRPTLLKWLEKNGVEAAKYESIEKSFTVQSKVMRGRGLASQYKVTLTPTLVIDGRFHANFSGDPFTFLSTAVNRVFDDIRHTNSMNAASAAKTPAKTAPAKAAPAKAAPAKTAPAKPAPAAPAK